jgi:hypothetical protein
VNETIRAAIAAELATLTKRVADVPAAPLGYGTDLSCVTDVTADAAEVDPMSRQAVAEAITRRLTTPRGGLIDDPDYGFDVRTFCNRGTTPTELRAIGDQCRTEALKDDRVNDATITADYDDAARRLRVSVMLDCVDPRLGTFTLTLAVTPDGEALLETIGGA